MRIRGIQRKERDKWETGETTEIMGDQEIYCTEEGERGVGDWGRQWVTGETTETMGTGRRREKSGRLGENISSVHLVD